MNFEAKTTSVIIIRIAAILFVVHFTINLPDEIYQSIRSEPLYTFPEHPMIATLIIWVSEMFLAAILFLSAGPLSNLAVRKINPNMVSMDAGTRALSGVLLVIMAIYLILEGFQDLSSILIFSFNDKVGWNPFSGGLPNLFYDSIEAILKFGFAFIIVFRKEWLPGIGFWKK